MLLRETAVTIGLGEHGYLLGVAEPEPDFPAEMPYGWRCGPATPATAVVLTTTDTGPLHLRVEVHDAPPPPDTTQAWEQAEEMSLRADTPALHVNILDDSFRDAWPPSEPRLRLPADTSADDGAGWMRMRLHCRADSHEPGIGNRGETHLLQLWAAPYAPEVHPPLSAEAEAARAEYAAMAAAPSST